MSDSWQDLPNDSFDPSNNDFAEGNNTTEDGFKDANVDFVKGIREMEARGLVDIGALASWTVSSYKPGSGAKELRDDSPFTYWQSDGKQPHHLDIHFSKKVPVAQLSIYNNFSLDESYTPSKIVVLAGHGFHDLLEVVTLNLETPTGWTHVEFNQIEGLEKEGLKTFLIRLLIVANHQHGKDTHLRAVKVYSPMTVSTVDSTVLGAFTSAKLLSESRIR